MLKIFQVGNVPVHLHQQKWHGWDVKTGNKPENLLWSATKSWQSSQFLIDTQSIKISSVVVDETGRTARQQIEAIKARVGLPTTVIAYDIISLGTMDSCLCHFGGSQTVMWYSTLGMISSASEDQEADDFTSITLDIALNPFWQPLNRYFWNWQGGDFDPYYPLPVQTPYADFIQKYPDTSALVKGFGDYHWSRRPVDRLVAYDPTLWAVQHLNTGLDFQTGFGSSWGASFHGAVSDPEWTAPPLSLYAFKNATGVGAINIKVTHESGIQYTTTIDLATTNDRLLAAGYPALQLTDVIYVGDCYPKPGFILRDGAVLPTLPAVTYPGMWPGQLSTGRNGVIYDMLGSIQAAYSHTFRKI